MPWEETMDQRMRAVMDVLDNGFSKASVCEDFRISRPTLDKWLKRYEAEGVEGLRDRILEGRDDEEAHGDDPPRMNVPISAHAEARAKYRPRKQTVEPVFGTIKKLMGFTQFQLRGHENVSGEWQLVTLAYNMKRLWRMQSAQNQGI